MKKKTSWSSHVLWACGNNHYYWRHFSSWKVWKWCVCTIFSLILSVVYFISCVLSLQSIFKFVIKWVVGWWVGWWVGYINPWVKCNSVRLLLLFFKLAINFVLISNFHPYLNLCESLQKYLTCDYSSSNCSVFELQWLECAVT